MLAKYASPWTTNPGILSLPVSPPPPPIFCQQEHHQCHHPKLHYFRLFFFRTVNGGVKVFSTSFLWWIKSLLSFSLLSPITNLESETYFWKQINHSLQWKFYLLVHLYSKRCWADCLETKNTCCFGLKETLPTAVLPPISVQFVWRCTSKLIVT